MYWSKYPFRINLKLFLQCLQSLSDILFVRLMTTLNVIKQRQKCRLVAYLFIFMAYLFIHSLIMSRTYGSLSISFSLVITIVAQWTKMPLLFALMYIMEVQINTIINLMLDIQKYYIAIYKSFQWMIRSYRRLVFSDMTGQ